MGWKALDYDRFTGLKIDLLTGENDGKVRARYREDVEPLLDRNKFLQNDGSRYARQKKSGLVHVASVPPTIQIEWREKYGVNIFDKNSTKEIMRLLNRPEYKYLKTTTKRI